MRHGWRESGREENLGSLLRGQAAYRFALASQDAEVTVVLTQTPLSLANTAPETSYASVSLCAFTGRPYGAFDAHLIKSKSSNESKEMDEMDFGK